MLSESEKKESAKGLINLRKEIQTLKEELNEIDKQKEYWFNQKNEVGKNIVSLISEVKNSKGKRNKKTDNVKNLKKQRDIFNRDINKKIQEIKQLRSEKDSIAKKKKIKESPKLLKDKIEKLELSIEIEGMSFDQEQKVMKNIKDIKKQYEEMGEFAKVFDKINILSKEIDKLKKEAKKLHGNIQTEAAESQKEHESLIEKSKEVDALKKGEEEAYKKFFEFKQKFVETNSVLKEKLAKINEINKKLDTNKKEQKKEKKKIETKKLMDKSEEVEDKIKKGKKLTTEDLLVFQKTQIKED